jgi:ABC-type enterobactin transport system permease subunit
MHPIVSLTGIIMGLTTAFLVFFKGWNPTTAGLIVSGIGLMLVTVALGALLVMVQRGERAGFLRYVLSVMRKDLDESLRWFHLKQ